MLCAVLFLYFELLCCAAMGYVLCVSYVVWYVLCVICACGMDTAPKKQSHNTHNRAATHGV